MFRINCTQMKPRWRILHYPPIVNANLRLCELLILNVLWTAALRLESISGSRPKPDPKRKFQLGLDLQLDSDGDSVARQCELELKLPTQVALGDRGNPSNSSSCEKLLRPLLARVGGHYSAHLMLARSFKQVPATLMLVNRAYALVPMHKNKNYD
ncbi:unnamed protein product [Dovyalis caffra]|uniref:Uncharacterized protein n=1 Tax=Dovyalis caffra TaxID=77055 RepID=A0AAV1RKN9_9ROSI|nr:unnamed protein product [Dovyalis caffra]